MPDPASTDRRRRLLALAVSALGVAATSRGAAQTRTAAPAPDARWYAAAVRMRTLAESWGDQSYGAVLVLGEAIVGEGPSRVVRNGDPTAHAEREAIRDAQRKLGRTDLAGTVLYSTSRPCSTCEAAAAAAGVARMIFGASLTDGGVPGAARR